MNNDLLTKSRAEGSDVSLIRPKSDITPGSMTEVRFWLLIEISSIHSNKVINALYEHCVLGYTRGEVCERNAVSAGYLSISVAKLLRIEGVAVMLAAC